MEIYKTYSEEPLLGEKYCLAPRDLLYLFFDIEKEFGITIPEDDILAKKFNSIKNLIGIIETQLQARKLERQTAGTEKKKIDRSRKNQQIECELLQNQGNRLLLYSGNWVVFFFAHHTSRYGSHSMNCAFLSFFIRHYSACSAVFIPFFLSLPIVRIVLIVVLFFFPKVWSQTPRFHPVPDGSPASSERWGSPAGTWVHIQRTVCN